jgi:hypothetical protein
MRAITCVRWSEQNAHRRPSSARPRYRKHLNNGGTSSAGRVVRCVCSCLPQLSERIDWFGRACAYMPPRPWGVGNPQSDAPPFWLLMLATMFRRYVDFVGALRNAKRQGWRIPPRQQIMRARAGMCGRVTANYSGLRARIPGSGQQANREKYLS